MEILSIRLIILPTAETRSWKLCSALSELSLFSLSGGNGHYSWPCVGTELFLLILPGHSFPDSSLHARADQLHHRLHIWKGVSWDFWGFLSAQLPLLWYCVLLTLATLVSLESQFCLLRLEKPTLGFSWIPRILSEVLETVKTIIRATVGLTSHFPFLRSHLTYYVVWHSASKISLFYMCQCFLFICLFQAGR